MFGISPDSAESHRKFKEKYGLRTTLLVDADRAVCKAYGVWQKKSTFGKSYMGVARTTFIVDDKGKVAHVFEKVSPAGHAAAVAKVLEGLQRAEG